MNKTALKIYEKHFRHFSERLSLRYGILITMQDYIELHSKELETIIEEKQEKDGISLEGYISIKGEKVRVVKSIFISGRPLITALPITFKPKVKKKNKKRG